MSPMPEEHASRPDDPVGKLVTGLPVSVSEKLTLRSIAAVLAADDLGAVLVHRDTDMHGIVSERDLVRALADDGDPDAVWSVDVMSEPLHTVDRDATILSVAVRMVAEDIRHMVVTSGDDVIGVVSSRDVFRVLTVDALEAAGVPVR
jgi:signal-transduction protein with cAMP-binding, CBS, and nucleotidyltransferase domain